MENELIKARIESIWNAVKLSKASELERHLCSVRERVTEIIGSNEIQKIRHSSLLKLLIYELIVFADEKTSHSAADKSTSRSADSSRSSERGPRGIQRLEEIKELVCVMSQSGVGEIRVQVAKFKTLLQRIRGLERELVREEEEKRRGVLNMSDSEGTELMIEQLEEIIRRKENRIKELNLELQENFNDKQMLEEQIDHLELVNAELDAKVRELEGTLARADLRSQEQAVKLNELREEFEKYKLKEKEELLFGVNSFMNIEHPLKREVEESTLRFDAPGQTLTASTKVLQQYFQPKTVINENTVKKKPIQPIESEEEDDLLISIRPPSPVSPQLENPNRTLERMLLMQAVFIESFLENNG